MLLLLSLVSELQRILQAALLRLFGLPVPCACLARQAYRPVIKPNPAYSVAASTLQQLDGIINPQHQLPINQGPVSIKSAFFEGVMEIHLRGLPNTQQQLFEGKKRFFQVMCQVRVASFASCSGIVSTGAVLAALVAAVAAAAAPQRTAQHAAADV